MPHIPVLQKEVLEYLDPKPNENFIDATIGEGGHAAAILSKNKPNGRVLGIEIDSEIYALTKEKIAEFPISNFQFPKNRLILVNDSYANLKEIVEKLNFGPVKGILMDLGMSSWQLEESGRGFSFQKDEPLDMKYNAKIPNSKFQIPNKFQISKSKIQNDLTAKEIINNYTEGELEKIIKEYGQEKFARKIVKEILKQRKIKPIETTFQLVEIIKRAVPSRYQHQRIHPATRTFQALRIAVNDELNNLKKVLPQTVEVLEKGGRIVIISFHSSEERIVKFFFKDYSHTFKILTKKPISPSLEELKNNIRARSAKLRAAEKI